MVTLFGHSVDVYQNPFVCTAAALAALELMVRFQKGLQLDPRRLPSPDQAEQALASPAEHSQAC